jgi:hypothetical protein
MVGTWTYTGTALTQDLSDLSVLERQRLEEVGFGGTRWKKWVVKNNGTVQCYAAKAVDNGWGEPITRRWNINAHKYTDTGEQYYTFDIVTEEGDEHPSAPLIDGHTAIIYEGRAVHYQVGRDKFVIMDRGDKFPFTVEPPAPDQPAPSQDDTLKRIEAAKAAYRLVHPDAPESERVTDIPSPGPAPITITAEAKARAHFIDVAKQMGEERFMPVIEHVIQDAGTSNTAGALSWGEADNIMLYGQNGHIPFTTETRTAYSAWRAAKIKEKAEITQTQTTGKSTAIPTTIDTGIQTQTTRKSQTIPEADLSAQTQALHAEYRSKHPGESVYEGAATGLERDQFPARATASK